jgi:AcrR family transcriptional regulator
VSEGTVFHYFGSKNALMLAILDRFYNDTLNPRAAGILDTVMGTRERLRALALSHVRALAADSALMLRLLQVYVGVDLDLASDHGSSPLRALNREYVGHFDRTLREGMQRGDLRGDLELRPLRDVFFGTLEYGLRTHLYHHGETGLEACVDALLVHLWRSLGEDADAPTGRNEVLQRLERAAARIERVTADLEGRGDVARRGDEAP